MDTGDLAAEIDDLFTPEVDEDMSPREWPHERLEKVHGLNFDFMTGFDWEGSTMHTSTRLCLSNKPDISKLTRNSDVPLRLFEAALRLFGDSLVTYANAPKHVTSLRFYPPVVLTFWSAFEAFVRHTSEMLVVTSKALPEPIADYLRELSPVVSKKGTVQLRTRHYPVLDRYSVALRYGFGQQVDYGSKFWQGLERAKVLRDYYTHIEAMNSRSISTAQVLDFIEAVLLAIIWPSAVAKRTLLIGAHHLYAVLASLDDMTAKHLPSGHIEEPFFHSWHLEDKPFMFYCPFDDVDIERFPNLAEDRRRNP